MESINNNQLSQEDYNILFKMSQQTNRHKDMLEFACLILQITTDLTIEEREIIATAYKTAISVRKQELEVLKSIFLREEEAGNSKNIDRIKNYKVLLSHAIFYE